MQKIDKNKKKRKIITKTEKLTYKTLERVNVDHINCAEQMPNDGKFSKTKINDKIYLKKY